MSVVTIGWESGPGVVSQAAFSLCHMLQILGIFQQAFISVLLEQFII